MTRPEAAFASARPDGDRASLVLEYRLDLADALAWERRAPGPRKRDRMALAVGLFAGLGLLQMLSGRLETVPGLHSVPVAVGLLVLPVLLVAMVRWRDRRRRAEARIGEAEAGIGVRLEIWPDRLIEQRADRPAPLVVGARSLRHLRETGAHVFLAFGAEEVVIVPARAFATPEDKAEFAARWRAHGG